MHDYYILSSCIKDPTILTSSKLDVFIKRQLLETLVVLMCLLGVSCALKTA
jgi:hypothetical protein